MQAFSKHFWALTITSAVVFSLAACGQKGTLFIPEDPDAEKVQDATRAATEIPDNNEEKSFFKKDSENNKSSVE